MGGMCNENEKPNHCTYKLSLSLDTNPSPLIRPHKSIISAVSTAIQHPKCRSSANWSECNPNQATERNKLLRNSELTLLCWLEDLQLLGVYEARTQLQRVEHKTLERDREEFVYEEIED